ncbi:MAG: 3-hydroxyacyl-CoA dehydrogenase NAD-binding domain-containing protein [Chitinophagaceae bacterium]
MSIASINSICICGAGTMGSGIAQTAAQAGFHTILYDVNKEGLNKAEASIIQRLQQLVDKNKITPAQKDLALSQLRFSADMNDCIADVFIEAIVEQPAAKTALFNQLHEFNHSEVVFATNTSSLSVSAIAKNVIYPQRVVGMHFFNPAPIMPLVEVVKGKDTSEETITTIIELAKQLGKTPVCCEDSPGFIVNRVARPYYLEALRLMEAGVAIETIDTLMEASGFKMGPFKLMDLIGNDINYAVSNSIYEALGKPARLAPSAIQKEKVEKGELGRKSGKGYYDYPPTP